MAAITWASGVSGVWDNAANWSPAQAPGSGDTAAIGPGIAAEAAWTVTASDVSLGALLLSAGGFGTLAVSGSFAVAGALTVSSGTLQAASGSLITDAGFSITGGGVSLDKARLADSGAQAALNGGLVALTDGAEFDAAALAISGGGTLSLDATSFANVGNATTTPGEVGIGSNARLTGSDGEIAGTVNNASSVIATAPATAGTAFTITGDLTGTGSIETQTGAALTVDGPWNSAGGVSVDTFSVLAVSGALSLGTGTITVGQAAVLDVTGTLSADTLLAPATVYDLHLGGPDVTTLVLAGTTTLDLAGNLNVTYTAELAAGASITAGGTIGLTKSGTLSDAHLSAAGFALNGYAGGSLTIDGGSFAAGGSGFTIAGSVSLDRPAGGGRRHARRRRGPPGQRLCRHARGQRRHAGDGQRLLRRRQPHRHACGRHPRLAVGAAQAAVGYWDLAAAA